MLRIMTPRAALAPGLAPLVFAAACAHQAPEARGAPEIDPQSGLLLRVTRPGEPGVVYLTGTVHARSPEDAPIDEAVWSALDEADVVWFEAADAPPSSVEGPSLGAVLDPGSRESLDRGLSALGLAPTALDELHPLGALLFIHQASTEVHGELSWLGTDRTLQRAAQVRGKPMRGLESWEARLQLLSAEALAEAAVEEARTLEVPRPTRISSARRGSSSSLAMGARDERMATQLLPLFASEHTHLVAVGLAHLIGEEDSLPARLEAMNAKVEPVPLTGTRFVDPRASAPLAERGRFERDLLEAKVTFPEYPGEPSSTAAADPASSRAIHDISARGASVAYHFIAFEGDASASADAPGRPLSEERLEAAVAGFLDTEVDITPSSDGVGRFTVGPWTMIARAIPGERGLYLAVGSWRGHLGEHDQRPARARAFAESLRVVRRRP